MFNIDAEDLRSRFERDGFVLVKGVFSAGACGEVIRQIEKLLPKHFSLADPKTWSGRVQDCCNNLPIYQRNGLLRYKDQYGFTRSPVFARHVHSNPRIRKLFKAVTGRSMSRTHIRGLHPILQMPRWISLSEAFGNRLNSQPWLKIPTPPQLPIGGHLDVHPVDVMMMAYLDHVSPRGGALAVWPGSHRLLQHCFSSMHEFFPTPAYKRAVNFLQQFKPVHISGSRGDLIIFHNRLLHSNTINRDERIRHAILIDVFGEGWSEEAERWKADKLSIQERSSLASTKLITSHALAVEVQTTLQVDPLRQFWSKCPRLKRLVQAIAKDPKATARRQLSAKIRARRNGDCWLVVSQGFKHRRSPKLDSHGQAELGTYAAALNGCDVFASVGGVLVEQIRPAEGTNTIIFRGTFHTDHYVRVIRTRNPLQESEILFSGVIPAASKGEVVHRVAFDCTAPSELAHLAVSQAAAA